jgi:hypothetical protein
MKTKTGEQITVKEFFKRWGAGINGITPIQQVKTQIIGTWITLLGISIGVVICAIGIRNLWWLMIILIGGLINTAVQQLGAYQRKKMLLQFDSAFKLAEEVKNGI